MLRPVMSALGYLAVVAVTVYLLFGLMLYLSQEGMIYYPDLPSRAVTLTPDAHGMDYEPVGFDTEDGERLRGWFIPAQQARATLLFHHGNAGNISHRLDSIRLFHDLGLSVFIFDYRGYGESSGRPSEAGTYRDAEAAWRQLTVERAIDPRTIVIFGRSLGAAIAAHLARVHPPRALILESAFTSVPDFGAEHYPLFPVRLLARIRYDTRQALRSVRSPVLIVHSRDDEIIPFRHGEQLYEAANEPKRFLPIHGDHNAGFLVSGERYREGLREFLNIHLDKQTTGAPL